MRFASLLAATTATPSAPSLRREEPRHMLSWRRLWPLVTTAALIYLPGTAEAINFNPVPAPNLDLSKLGRVGLAGDFDSISLYQYQQQNENGFNTNGSQSILTRFPDGSFATLSSADAYIQSMCPFVMKNGKMAGVVVGGNFTSLGGIEAQGVAMFDPSTSNVTPLPGLSGKVAAVLCDQDTNTVYVGGDFKGANSTNAIAWVGMTGWANLPFSGFNGPVRSIVKAPNGNVIFGGSFDGLGSNSTSPHKKDQQIVNIAGANISASATTGTDGFNDPRNILCKFSGKSAKGNTWLLADNAAGTWRADFHFGFRPTKLRIWNTNQDGRGTKTFRYTAMPINGIMNLTYVDPDTGKNATCDARCPLPQNKNNSYTDFTFINVIGMSGFELDISEWYGNGGGLNGIELFQDDIYAFAINDLNEPRCANIDFPANASSTGPWAVTPSMQSSADYLTAKVSGNSNSDSAKVVFQPDIKQSGNYSVTIYTPGCAQDNSCDSRGRVNVTGNVATADRAGKPISQEVFQTNDYDKYDSIYTGYVEACSDSFRPSITLTASSGQDGDVQIVAQRVRFDLISSTGGLNGLYEFDPDMTSVSSDFSDSAINKAGMDLNEEAFVTNLIMDDGVTYVGGNFSTDDFDNIFMIQKNKSQSLPGGGLNAEVFTMFVQERMLYIGGNFSDTSKAKTDGLKNIALYSIQDKKWQAMGGGVDGQVTEMVSITLNITQNKPENVITVTGDFTQVLGFGSNKAAPAEGFAVWVPSQKNWLQNLNIRAPSIRGKLSVGSEVPKMGTLFAGTISSSGLSASDGISLDTGDTLGVNPLPIQIQPQSQTDKRKRADPQSPSGISGVTVGYFYEADKANVTVLAGHFTAQASDGSTINNILFVDGANKDQVTGAGTDLDANSVFQSLAVHNDQLFAGGSVTGSLSNSQINGLISYDLTNNKFSPRQPPALSGVNVSVNAIAPQPNTGDVYVGGNFDSAGQLNCPGVCIYSSDASQWNRPASGLTGNVSALTWSSNKNTLFVAGNLTFNSTSTSLVTYDAKARTWGTFDEASKLPGPVSAMAPAADDVSTFWVTGESVNGSAFLMKFDGKTFQSVGDTLGKTTRIRGLQLLTLAQKHGSSTLLDPAETLLLTGQLDIPGFGSASSALFNGTTFQPFLLSTQGNSAGSLSQIFTQRTPALKASGGHLAVGFVVLIALAIALALVFILVVIGILAERIRRKREGYVPAPTTMFERNSNGNMDRIPPQHLFGSLQGGGRPGSAPVI